uniref:hAT-like transposase RNase-H fold domain-containing protein n=1 Tax=Cajanus cajan TaxID=3821 RepID=A0A151TZG6_CAJCA|nr:hypothetical protein KK1_004999 [Cajanus cajan]
MDLFGPTATLTLGGKKYGIVIIDGYFRYTWVFFLGHKHESFRVFEIFCKHVQNDYDKYWGKLDRLNMLLLIALVLHPRYKLKFMHWLINQIVDGVVAFNLKDKVESSMTLLFEEYNGGRNEFEANSQEARLNEEASDNPYDFKQFFKQKKVFYLLTSLGPEYETFATTMLKPRRPSYSELVSQLQSLDQRRKWFSSRAKMQTCFPPQVAFYGQQQKSHQFFPQNRGNSQTFTSTGRGFKLNNQVTKIKIHTP